jgi:hypothetical protein
MTRFTSPKLLYLHACEMPQLRGTDRFKKAIEITARSNPAWRFRPEVNPSPVVLRWGSNPLLGFPVRPFEVYRRAFKLPDLQIFVRERQEVTGIAIVQWGLEDLYFATYEVVVPAGASMTVEALNDASQPLPGMRQVFTANGNGSFTVPGISALRASGTGVILNVRGLRSEDVVAFSDWELIELVGLPFKPGDVSRGYDTGILQGVVNPALEGYDAALVRLQIAFLLSDPPPPTGDLTIPSPGWVFPDPFVYRHYLCDKSPSPVEMVRTCLDNSDNTDPGNQQAAFKYKLVTPGPRQANLPGATPSASLPDTNMDIPVVGVTLLSATNDSFAAAGLGYGTVDFPALQPEDGNNQGLNALQTYQYMVVGEFETPFGRLEIAALSSLALPPAPPSDLQSRRNFLNRPSAADGPLSESVELSWLLPETIQGYAVAVSRVDGTVDLLNQPHRDGWHHPFIPDYPYPQNGAVPAGTRARFSDHNAPVSYTINLVSDYIVNGLDVFNRWSAWRKTSQTSSPPPVQKPGIHSVNFIQDGVPLADGSIPYRIEIDFSWNQEDRRVHAIDFLSKTFALTPGADPGAVPGSFQLVNTLAGTAPLRLLFDAAGVPRLPAGSPFTIDLPVAPAPLDPPDPDLLKYVVVVRGASLRFPAGTVKLGYAVYARAYERVREPNPNTDAVVSAPSDATNPIVATIIDPRPPDTPVLTPSLSWTALPDATGRARGVLQWPVVDRAVGYVVWQATETALRQAMDPPMSEPLPGTSLIIRAGALQTLLSNADNQIRALRVFSRLNTELVRSNRLEIDLPAAANTLYAFRVSAVSENNEQSERSNGMVLFGVPRRNEPGRPRVMLRAFSGGIFVVCLAAPGVAVDGFNVYRVRDPALLIDPGTFGDPRITPTTTGWQDLASLPATPDWDIVRSAIRTLPQPVIGQAVLDTTAAPSWRPYYYVAVALGVENTAAGDYRGESQPSGSQSILAAPSGPPALAVTSFTTEADGSKLLQFTTNLPVRPSPAGTATLVLYANRTSGGRAQREKIIEAAADSVAQGALSATGTPAIARGAPDVSGVAAYSVRVAADVNGGAIVVADPLGRASERTFPE